MAEFPHFTVEMHTRFILIEPSHAGNVGAVARAMKVMGFEDLVLVRPRWPDVLLREEAHERASGATDVLQKARVVEHLDQALEGMHHVCATAMTPRDFGPVTRSPREHFAHWLQQPLAQQPDVGVAFLFGPERYGMANDDVYRSQVCLSIPTHPEYGSLNLAAAVQLIAYDWRQALGGYSVASPAQPSVAADMASLEGTLVHWQEALVALQYLDPQQPKKLMPRLRQMLMRAQPSEAEVHILRGVARSILRVLGAKQG